MKRLLTLFIIMLALGTIAYWINQNKQDNQKTSINTDDRKFAVPRDQIAKFTVERVNQKKRTFEKKGDRWYADGEHLVSKHVMPYMLSVLSDIEVYNIPPKAMVPTIMGDLERAGIQVQVFDNKDNLLKSYRIGLPAPAEQGITFLMDGYEQPYNMFIKGFDGDVRPRLIQELDRIRDRKVFEYQPENIQSITIDYPKDLKSSFVLEQKDGVIELSPKSKLVQPINGSPNQIRAKSYLMAFNRLYAEGFENQNPKRDSISNLLPFASVSVTDANGEIRKADFYPLADLFTSGSNTREVEEAMLIDRYFINTNWGDFMLVQQRVFKNIFRSYDYFYDNIQ